MNALPQQNLKGYELRERIGAGGFGAVYRAYQSTVGREVAIKFILPGFASQTDFIRRFESEAQLVARLEHPHITPLYDYWRDPDGAYLVMRWLRGGSLREALQNAPFDLRSAALLLDQIAGALSVAHRNNVIHRDIKPGNILLDEDGNAYLTDFGIAKDLNLAGNHTQPDAIVGSLDYISPEQARSEIVTPRTDIYSLGVTLYEVIVGNHPFQTASTIEKLYKHINDSLPEITTLSPPELADAVNKVIQKATAKNPQQRYPDALAFAADFREAIGMGRTPTNVVELLTQREHEILQLIIEGLSNKEIAQKLTVTLSTVKWYINQIYSKLGVRSRVQAIVRARELNLLVKSGEASEAVPVPTEEFHPVNPYKGLRAFQSSDNQDFFGRERVTTRLVVRMGETGEYRRFLALVGPSGSGKSSLMKAGLIPALWRGELAGSEKWFIVDMLPGRRPLDELEIALTKVAANQSGNLREQLARDENGLLRASSLILPNDDSCLVVIIDQFEEVFTLVEDEAERLHFLSLLVAAVKDPRSRVRIVITLRADFYDRPLHYPEFAELLRNRLETILPLSADELENAIVRPCEQAGLKFEPGLVSSIVSDVNYQAGALPLMQYALTELFERREGRLLTRKVYQEIGGAVGALAKRAEELYLDLMPEGQEVARQMFMRLVTLGEGVEDTRRRTARSELLAIAPESDVMDEMIDTYTNYRLLSLDNDPTTHSPTVELAHEAILCEWERLRSWLSDGREDIRLERQLMNLNADWERAGKDHSFLLRGARLATFEKWVSQTELALTPGERNYFQVSLANREHEQAAETERQAHVTVLQQRSVRFLRALVAVLILAVLGALGLTGAVARQSDQTQVALATSDANLLRANSLRLAAEANSWLNQGKSGERSALLAIRALQNGYFPQADTALLASIARGFIRQNFLGHTVAFSPDGAYVVSGTRNPPLAYLWDAQTGKEIRRFEGHSDEVLDVAVSPNGRFIATTSADGTARLWDIQTGSEIRRFAHNRPVQKVSFSPDGNQILTATDGLVAVIWDVNTGKEIRHIQSSAQLTDAVYSPDGLTIATSAMDNVIHLWDSQTGAKIRDFNGHNSSVYAVAYSPDGRFILSSSEDQTIRLWNVQTGTEVRQFVGQGGRILSIGFSPDSRYVITGSDDTTTRLWEVQSGNSVRNFGMSAGSVTDIVFSTDGRYVVIAGSVEDAPDASMWDMQVVAEPRILSLPSGVNDAAFSPDMKYIATTYDDDVSHSIALWDMETNEIIRRLEGPYDFVPTVVFSQDSHYLLAGSLDNVAWLFDVNSGSVVKRFVGHTGVILKVAYSHDGQYVLTAGADLTIRLWNVETGAQLRMFKDSDVVDAVAFSPDDRYVIASSADAKIRSWDTDSGAENLHLDLPYIAYRLSVSHDGRYILIGTDDHNAHLLDAATGTEIRKFSGHSTPLSGAVFSPDDRYILTAGLDSTALLWDTQTGQIVREFVGHNGIINNVDFSTDGQYVLTAGQDNTVRIWRTNLTTVIAEVCANLPRDFTDGERILYDIADKTPSCSQFATPSNP